MKPAERQQQLLNRLRATGHEWRVDDLAGELRVSPLTIRRDLDVLESAGAIVRTLGGCLALTRSQTTAYQQRVAERFDCKRGIGLAAAAEVRAGNQILINDGSTTFHLASCLGGSGPITVFTNSLAMVTELGRYDSVRLFILGGEYQRELNCLGGALLDNALEGIRADIAFLGADAVDDRGRCLAATPEAARDARCMLCAARRAILLADASKTALRAGTAFGQLADFDLWITTAGMTRAQLQRFKRLTRIKEVTL